MFKPDGGGKREDGYRSSASITGAIPFAGEATGVGAATVSTGALPGGASGILLGCGEGAGVVIGVEPV